jgi:hypothetical protein
VLGGVFVCWVECLCVGWSVCVLGGVFVFGWSVCVCVWVECLCLCLGGVFVFVFGWSVCVLGGVFVFVFVFVSECEGANMHFGGCGS